MAKSSKNAKKNAMQSSKAVAKKAASKSPAGKKAVVKKKAVKPAPKKAIAKKATKGNSPVAKKASPSKPVAKKVVSKPAAKKVAPKKAAAPAKKPAAQKKVAPKKVASKPGSPKAKSVDSNDQPKAAEVFDNKNLDQPGEDDGRIKPAKVEEPRDPISQSAFNKTIPAARNQQKIPLSKGHAPIKPSGKKPLY